MKTMLLKKVIKKLCLLKTFFIIIGGMLFVAYIFINIQDPYINEDRVKDMIKVGEYTSGDYNVNEYVVKIKTKAGTRFVLQNGYYLVYIIELESFVGNSTMRFNNLAYTRIFTNLFNPTVKTGDKVFDKYFFLFSEDPQTTLNIFDDETRVKMLSLAQRQIIYEEDLNPIRTSDNKIELRLHIINTVEDIPVDIILSDYPISVVERYDIISLLAEMANNINSGEKER